MGLFGPKGEKEYKKGRTLRSIYVHGTNEDPRYIDDALVWLDKAIAKGYGEALLEKARIYAGGEGNVRKDPAYALRLRKQAYDMGLTHAAYAIADQYLNGEGVARDLAKVYEYCCGAARDKSAVSYARLAECHIYGYGCAVDPQKANELLDAAERAVLYDWEANSIYSARGKLALSQADGSDEAPAMAWYRKIRKNGGDGGELLELIQECRERRELEQLPKQTEINRSRAAVYFAPNAPGHSPEIEAEPDDSEMVRCSFRHKDGDVRALIVLPSGAAWLKYARRFIFVPKWGEYYVELAETSGEATLWQYVVADGRCWIGQSMPMELADMDSELQLDVSLCDLPEGFGLEYLKYN